MKPPHKWSDVTKAGKGASLRQSRRLLRKGKAISGVIAEDWVILINCFPFLKLKANQKKFSKKYYSQSITHSRPKLKQDFKESLQKHIKHCTPEEQEAEKILHKEAQMDQLENASCGAAVWWCLTHTNRISCSSRQAPFLIAPSLPSRISHCLCHNLKQSLMKWWNLSKPRMNLWKACSHWQKHVAGIYNAGGTDRETWGEISGMYLCSGEAVDLPMLFFKEFSSVVQDIWK